MLENKYDYIGTGYGTGQAILDQTELVYPDP